MTFLPEHHEYYYDGKRWQSVTEVLDGLRYSGNFTEQQSQRGTAVHHACHLLNIGKLRWESVHHSIIGYVMAYEKYLRTTGFKPLFSEVPLCDPELMVAGTLDHLGRMPDGRWRLGDIKTGDVPITAGPQTAEYLRMVRYWWEKFGVTDYDAVERVGIRLYEGEGYEVVDLNDPMDERVFKSQLDVKNWLDTKKL